MVLNAIWRTGVRSASDLAHMFTSEGEAMEWLEATVPEVPAKSAAMAGFSTSLLATWYRSQTVSRVEIARMTTAAVWTMRRQAKEGAHPDQQPTNDRNWN